MDELHQRDGLGFVGCHCKRAEMAVRSDHVAGMGNPAAIEEKRLPGSALAKARADVLRHRSELRRSFENG